MRWLQVRMLATAFLFSVAGWTAAAAAEDAPAGADSPLKGGDSPAPSPAASAPEPPSPVPETPQLDPQALSVVAGKVRGQSRMRVLTHGGETRVLWKPEAVPDGLRYQGVAGERDLTPGFIPWRDVSELQARKSLASRGAMLGGAVLGTAGLALGAAATKECSGGWFSLEPCGASTGDVVLITVIGAGAGAFLGALVASPFRSWRTVFESEPSGMRPNPSLSLVPAPAGGVGLALSLVPR